MSKSKRKKLEKESAKQAADTQAVVPVWQGKRIIFIFSAVFIALILIIIGINHFFSEDQKYYRIDIISVDDTTVDMDYFVRRCHAAGSDPMNMLSSITRELVIRKEAEKLGIDVTDQMIENKLIETAQGTSESISQSEFKELYNQRLNESGLSDDEYREIVGTSLLSETFYDLLVETMSTIAEQVHLNIIVTDTEEEAIEVRARWEAGEDFADLAREVSIDATTRENGGDAGWIPRGVAYESRLDAIVFDELKVGDVSEPLPYYNTSAASSASQEYVDYYLVLVSEKTDAREIDEEYIQSVRDNAYDDWIAQMLSEHSIQYHGIRNGFDSETYSWINWQLQKMTGTDDE